MFKIQSFIITLLLFINSTFIGFAHASTIELGERSTSSNGVIWVAKDGDDTQPGTSALLVASLTEAVKKSYAYGQAIIYVRQGTYSASLADSTGGRVWVTGHPRLLFFKAPDATGNVLFNAGFRVQNGASVTFRGINFNQNGNMGGIPQIFAENSSVYFDDGNASYSSGGVGFLRTVNSWASIRATSDQNVNINYRNYDGTSAIVEADYGSYLFIAGNKNETKMVQILTSDSGATGVYLTGSNIYASNMTIQGKDNNGIGLLLNRGSRGRILAHEGQSLSWFYRLDTGMLSQNGSSLYLSGPIRVRLNNTGLKVLSGSDIKYSDNVQTLLHSNTTNVSVPSVPDNIIKAY